MKKIMIATVIVGACSHVSAESNNCNYSMNFNVDINEERILFNQKDDKIFEFKGNQLLINGKSVELTSEQIRASKSLQNGTRELVPEIAEIAIEGAELGVKITTMVLSSLFGDDQQMQSELIVPIEAIATKIKQNISKKSLNTEALGQSLENAFDDEFEKMIETAVTKYSGKIISNAISSVFSGDTEELEDLEFRMENLEQEIEEYAEVNAKKLEVKADAICLHMAELDKYDSQLEGVEGYPEGGLLLKGKKAGYKFTNFSYND